MWRRGREEEEKNGRRGERCLMSHFINLRRGMGMGVVCSPFLFVVFVVCVFPFFSLVFFCSVFFFFATMTYAAILYVETHCSSDVFLFLAEAPLALEMLLFGNTDGCDAMRHGLPPPFPPTSLSVCVCVCGKYKQKHT